MRKGSYLFTSESVSEGNPDKVCDRISDAVVDAYLTAEPHSRVAIETLATTNRIVIAGETRRPATITHQPSEAIVLVPIGVAVLFAGIHLVNIATALHACWARFLLGSRPRPVPPVSPPPQAPPPCPARGPPTAPQP